MGSTACTGQPRPGRSQTLLVNSTTALLWTSDVPSPVLSTWAYNSVQKIHGLYPLGASRTWRTQNWSLVNVFTEAARPGAEELLLQISGQDTNGLGTIPLVILEQEKIAHSSKIWRRDFPHTFQGFLQQSEHCLYTELYFGHGGHSH